jgi:hypothetical protein
VDSITGCSRRSGPDTNEFTHVRPSQTRRTHFIVLFLRELRENKQVADATFLVDPAHYFENTLVRLGF